MLAAIAMNQKSAAAKHFRTGMRRQGHHKWAMSIGIMRRTDVICRARQRSDVRNILQRRVVFPRGVSCVADSDESVGIADLSGRLIVSNHIREHYNDCLSGCNEKGYQDLTSIRPDRRLRS